MIIGCHHTGRLVADAVSTGKTQVDNEKTQVDQVRSDDHWLSSHGAASG